MNRILLFLITSLTLLQVGCGPDNPLGRKAVQGTITLHGQPLANGSIQFAPQQSGVSSGAEIRDGHFEIAEEKGLTPGTYTVRVYSTDESSEAVEPTLPGPGVKVQPELIPADYNTNSQLELVVAEADEKVVFDLDIQDKK